MNVIYDNWERLGEAVLRREQLRQLAIYSESDDSLSAAWDEDIYLRASPSPPSSRNRLSEVLKRITQWMSELDLVQQTKIPWTESHLLVILNYVLGAEAINPYFCAESSAYSWLDDVVWSCRLKPEYSQGFAASVARFMVELQELFEVPRLQQYYDSSDKTELVAAFITFLLHLLDYETELIVSFDDRIFSLKKALRFLVAILGDTPFQGTDGCDELEYLLAEFEAVADRAGSLVYSFIFTTQELIESRPTIMDDLTVLFEYIELLEANIIKFSDSLPGNMNPKTCAVESIFIVDSLLFDLEDLMNREDDRIVDVKDQIKVVHQGLTLSRSLLKDKNLPQHSEIKELKDLAMQTRDVAYEAEYLINSFLVGDAPPWYLTTRLPHVIHRIELIETGLQEIKKNYNRGALQVAKDLSAQLSLQPKRNPDVLR